MAAGATSNWTSRWRRQLLPSPRSAYEAERQAQFLRIVYGFQILCWTFIPIIDRGRPSIIAGIIQVSHGLLCYLLFSRGRYEFARISFPFVWLVSVSLVVGTGDGTHDVGVLAYPCLIFATAYLLGRLNALVMTLATIVALCVMYYRDVTGINQTPFAEDIVIDDIIFLILILGANLGVIAFVVGEMRNDLENAQANEARYRLLAENASDVVQVVGLDLKTQYISPSILKQRGYTAEEFTKLPPGTDLDPDDFENLVRELEVEIQEDAGRDPDRSRRFDVRVRRKDGSWMWVEAVFTGIRDEQGTMTGVLAVWRDIEERRRAEQEQLEIQNRMQELQRMEGLGILAGGIAHDFNNLLAGIIGNADLARGEIDSSSPAREKIDEVVRVSDLAADLCRQLLAYSGRGKFEVENIDLNDFLGDMERVLALTAGRDVSFSLECPDSLPPIQVDVTQLRQIVINLVRNSAEAIRDRKGVITLRTGQAAFNQEELDPFETDGGAKPGTFVFLEVEDNGSGMDEPTRQKIFEPFFTTKPRGHGLGLAAIMGIVRAHGGMIHVYSEPGEGTRIRVYFPQAEGPASRPAALEKTPDTYNGKGKILVIDDEATIRLMATTMLESRGFQVVGAEDGREGIEKFNSMRGEVRLVLLDMTMPVMSGNETLRRLREISPQLPVILTSGFSRQQVLRDVDDPAFTGFLQKPFRLAELDELVRTALHL